MALRKAMEARGGTVGVNDEFLIFNMRFSHNPILSPSIPRCGGCQLYTKGAGSMSDGVVNGQGIIPLLTISQATVTITSATKPLEEK